MNRKLDREKKRITVNAMDVLRPELEKSRGWPAILPWRHWQGGSAGLGVRGAGPAGRDAGADNGDGGAGWEDTN